MTTTTKKKHVKAQNKEPEREGKATKKKEKLKAVEYELFVQWLALPTYERTPGTQIEFSKKYKVSEHTISNWKKEEGLWQDVKALRKRYLRERLPDINMALYTNALKEGDAPRVKLAHQLAGDLDPDELNLGMTPQLEQALGKINNLLP